VVSARRGLRLIAVAVDTPLTSGDLVWARDAIDLAQQAGQAAFTGKPSPHWLDVDHFRVLLSSAVGDVSVRHFLDRLDGCSGSRARTDIAAQFLRRSAASLNEAEAAALLVRAQAATKAPKVKALRPLGRDAIPASAGYALASGTFTEGQHAPRAQIPFLVECWAEAFSSEERPGTSLACIPFMNRTRALAPCTGNAWAGHLDISISGTLIHEPAPAGPHYELVLNITSPMFRLTSDGKTPDCQPFRAALKEAIGNAAKQAGREIAALINSEEKRAAAQYRQQQREEE
jgi:hypothetical protein